MTASQYGNEGTPFLRHASVSQSAGPDLSLRSHMTVDLMQHMGNDSMVVAAARVSTNPEIAEMARTAHTAEEHAGLINYLMGHRHGTPFEHGALTVRVEAPIFVFREWHRHRAGWSYNEMSGRYSQLEPVFHIPGADRPLVNAGTSARPKMVPGSSEQYARLVSRMRDAYRFSYAAYLRALDDAVAKEVAREVLPVGIYSTMYATCNMRSAMHFLSLRIYDPDATFPSKPQYEIAQAASLLEQHFAGLFPITYEAFLKAGRVAP